MKNEELLKELINCAVYEFCGDKIISSLDDISIVKIIEEERLWDNKLERNHKKRSREYGVKVNGSFYSIYGEPIDVVAKGIKVFYIDEKNSSCGCKKQDLMKIKDLALTSLTNRGLYVFIG